MGACHPWPRQGPGRLSPVAPPGAWAPVALAAAFRRATHMRWAPRGKPCLELLGRARVATVPAFLLEPWLHAARNLAEGREHCFVPQHHSFFALLSFPFSGRRINVYYTTILKLVLYICRKNCHSPKADSKRGHLVWGVPAIVQCRREEFRGAYEKERARSESVDDCVREQRGLPLYALTHAPADCNANGRHERTENEGAPSLQGGQLGQVHGHAQ